VQVHIFRFGIGIGVTIDDLSDVYITIATFSSFWSEPERERVSYSAVFSYDDPADVVDIIIQKRSSE